MTFILLTCVPMLTAALLLQWEPHKPRRRHASPQAHAAPRRTLIHCHLALPLPL